MKHILLSDELHASLLAQTKAEKLKSFEALISKEHAFYMAGLGTKPTGTRVVSHVSHHHHVPLPIFPAGVIPAGSQTETKPQ